MTDKFYEAKKSGNLEFADEVKDCTDAIITIIDSIYDSRTMQPDNASDKNIELRLDKKKLEM